MFQLRNNFFNFIDRNGKTVSDIRVALSACINQRIHADDIAGAVDKRAAAVAAVDRSIRFDHIAVKPIFQLTQFHSRGTDNTDRNGRFIVYFKKSERIAECNRPLADHDIVRITHVDRRQPGSIDFQQTHIRRRIGTDEFRFHLFSADQSNRNIGRITCDMIVRYDISVSRNNKSGTESLHFLFKCPVAEKLFEKRVIEVLRKRIAVLNLLHGDDVNTDNGRAYFEDGASNGILTRDRDIVGRLCGLFLLSGSGRQNLRCSMFLCMSRFDTARSDRVADAETDQQRNTKNNDQTNIRIIHKTPQKLMPFLNILYFIMPA